MQFNYWYYTVLSQLAFLILIVLLVSGCAVHNCNKPHLEKNGDASVTVECKVD